MKGDSSRFNNPIRLGDGLGRAAGAPVTLGPPAGQGRASRRVCEAFPYHEARVHPLPARSPDRAPMGYWLAFLGLFFVALAYLSWGLSRHLGAGKLLRVVEGTPTLVRDAGARKEEPQRVRVALRADPLDPPPPAELPPPISVESPPLPPPKIELPPVVELPPLPPPVELPPPVVIPALPPIDIPPPPETPRPVVAVEPAVEIDEYPLVFTRADAPGDTPMMRNWKMLAIYSLTVVTLSQPAPLVAGEDTKKIIERLDRMDDGLMKSFKALGDDIKALNTDITKLKADTLADRIKLDTLGGKIEALETSVAKLQKEMDALRKRLDDPSRAAAPLFDKAGMDDLKAKLSAIEKAILSLQPSTSRVALSPPINGSVGRVMLVNNYGEELLFVINAKTFRVPAMTTQPIDGVPSGALSYEVISPTWGLRARRSTTLAANETFTLTAQ